MVYINIHLGRPLRKGSGVSWYIRRDYDYTEKAEMTVTTEYLECLLEEVVCVANKTKQNMLYVWQTKQNKTCCVCGKQNKTK